MAGNSGFYRKFLPLLLLLGLPLAAWGVSDVRENPVRAEAEKVFAYDRSHPQALPAHLIRKLSLTIAFCDDAGAGQVIQDLRRRKPGSF